MERKLLNIFLAACTCVLIASAAFAQNSVATISATTAIDGGIDKKTRSNEEQLAALAEKMAKLEAIIDAQQKKIDELQQKSAADTKFPFSTMAAPANISSTGARPVSQVKTPDPGISLQLGPNASITPVVMVDFGAVFRTKNFGNNVATGLGTIPFINTVTGNLTEIRLSSINSRFGLRFDADLKNAHMTGFFETDFGGNNAANLFVSANSNTNRMRVFWVDIRKGKYEVVGGQTWSLLQANRDGIGPLNENVFSTVNIDQNFQVGHVWARQAGIRFIYHASKKVQLGFSLENPQQYVGAGQVIFPFAFNAQLGSQFDAANNAGTPNLLPDVIGKVAYDSRGARNLHIEGAAIVRTFKNTYIPVGGSSYAFNTVVGYGGSFNVNLEVAKGIRIISNNFVSRGGGRYIGGLGPDLVVKPVATSSTTFTNSLSLVNAYSTVDGFEAKINDKVTVDGYYGGAYFARNAFEDPTSPLTVKPIIGFGGTNSSTSANRSIQEVTGGLTYTFWRDPKFGALQWVTQASFLTRSSWFTAAGAPPHANAYMVFSSFRYTMPGKPPAPAK